MILLFFKYESLRVFGSGHLNASLFQKKEWFQERRKWREPAKWRGCQKLYIFLQLCREGTAIFNISVQRKNDDFTSSWNCSVFDMSLRAERSWRRVRAEQDSTHLCYRAKAMVIFTRMEHLMIFFFMRLTSYLSIFYKFR